jgi:hypothetical protein
LARTLNSSPVIWLRQTAPRTLPASSWPQSIKQSTSTTWQDWRQKRSQWRYAFYRYVLNRYGAITYQPYADFLSVLKLVAYGSLS